MGAKFKFNIKWRIQIKEEDFRRSQYEQLHEDNLF